MVWQFCPKTSGSGKTVAEIATYEAVAAYNEGHSGRPNILKELGINPVTFAESSAIKFDLLRV